jgi:hypothetical protein
VTARQLLVALPSHPCLTAYRLCILFEHAATARGIDVLALVADCWCVRVETHRCWALTHRRFMTHDGCMVCYSDT